MLELAHKRHSQTKGIAKSLRGLAGCTEKWGPTLLSAPICAETRLPVFVSLSTRGSTAPRSLLTVSGVASETGSQSEDGFRPFHGPSWVNPSLRVACSRGSRVSHWTSSTLPAPLPAVRLGPGGPPHRHPVEIGSSTPTSLSCRCRLFVEAGTSVPITGVLMTRFGESRKRKNRVFACG